MQFKHHLSALLALSLWGGLSTAQAQSSIWLDLLDSSTPTTSVLNNGARITFKDGNLVLNNTDDTPIEIALSNLSKISFKNPTTGIGRLTSNNGTHIGINGDQIVAGGWDGTAESVAIHAVSGQTVYRNSNWNGEAISIAQLPKGIYILQTKKKTIKFTKQ